MPLYQRESTFILEGEYLQDQRRIRRSILRQILGDRLEITRIRDHSRVFLEFG